MAGTEQTRALPVRLEAEPKETMETAVEGDESEEPESGPSRWSVSVAAGAELQRGNTDTTDLHMELDATRTELPRELRLELDADYGDTEGETDTSRVFGEAKLKVFRTDRFYLFALTNMEYDEMENLDLRVQGLTGVGYEFIDNDTTQLLGEVGGGFTDERFDDNGADDTLEPTLSLTSEWKQKLFGNVEFSQQITLYPSLGDIGDFRLHSESAIKTPLGDHWAIELSLTDDYDSDPGSDDVKKNDLRVISSLEYTF